MNLKIFALILVFLGEIFAIYAETFAVKFSLWSGGFWKMFLIMSIGGFLLITGYLLGYRVYHNLWIITVISITTLLIAEPLVIYFIFNQIPSKGALIGFILGIIGLFCTLFF